MVAAARQVAEIASHIEADRRLCRVEQVAGLDRRQPTPLRPHAPGELPNSGKRLGMLRIFTTPFSSVYPRCVTKVEKKQRSKAELDQVISWLTGFDDAALQAHLAAETTYEDFFAAATMNPHAELITGVVCGVRVESVTDPPGANRAMVANTSCSSSGCQASDSGSTVRTPRQASHPPR